MSDWRTDTWIWECDKGHRFQDPSARDPGKCPLCKEYENRMIRLVFNHPEVKGL